MATVVLEMASRTRRRLALGQMFRACGLCWRFIMIYVGPLQGRLTGVAACRSGGWSRSAREVIRRVVYPSRLYDAVDANQGAQSGSQIELFGVDFGGQHPSIGSFTVVTRNRHCGNDQGHHERGGGERGRAGLLRERERHGGRVCLVIIPPAWDRMFVSLRLSGRTNVEPSVISSLSLSCPVLSCPVQAPKNERRRLVVARWLDESIAA